jgi:hypothetical protein
MKLELVFAGRHLSVLDYEFTFLMYCVENSVTHHDHCTQTWCFKPQQLKKLGL